MAPTPGCCFRRPLIRGYALAQKDLGALYLQGRGVAQSDATAARLFQDAARNGLAEAQALLADAYLGGRGVAQDDCQAAERVAPSGRPERQALPALRRVGLCAG